MNNKPNFFKIGLFVILGTLILAAAIIFFGAGKFFEKKYVVETYFNQSVQGLSVGAALTFQGVQVGNISEIGFVFQEYDTDFQYVLIRAQIYPNKGSNKGKPKLFIDDNDRERGLKHMIEKGLRLQLASQGVTGLAVLNAVYLEPESYPALNIDWKPEYPYIPSAPGTIQQITQTIEKLTETIQSIDFKEISDDVEQLVVTLNTAVQQADIPQVSKDLQSLLVTLDKTITNTDKLINSKDTKQTLANIAETTQELKRTLKRTDRLIQNREHNIEAILQNVERVSEDLSEFMVTVRRYPSWVIFGEPPPHFGHKDKEENKNQ
ncbi:MAG: glycerophosphoryl diester phosphodiesterase [Thermodesulfobacteriota bacterium]|nr:MAG: glycerophosphoryl diester phosphodiesterase [Thermodesulfobacteriota bacterium]